MKRFLKNNQHQLSMREQEEIWRGIEEKSGRTGAPRKRRGLGMPVFGLTSLTAASNGKTDSSLCCPSSSILLPTTLPSPVSI